MQQGFAFSTCLKSNYIRMIRLLKSNYICMIRLACRSQLPVFPRQAAAAAAVLAQLGLAAVMGTPFSP
jgi:hypothetical protein